VDRSGGRSVEAPDSSFQGVVKSTIKAVAKKVSQDSGEALVETASSYLSPIIEGADENLTNNFAGVFPKNEGERK
jgi:CHASE3 domain sensor protein